MALQPLNPSLLTALAREEDGEDDVDEGLEWRLQYDLRNIRRRIAEDEDWGTGVEELVSMNGGYWEWVNYTTKPTAKGRMENNKWNIEFVVGIVDLRPTKRDR